MSITKIHRLSPTNKGNTTYQTLTFILNDGNVQAFNMSSPGLQRATALANPKNIQKTINTYKDPTGNKFVDFQVAPNHVVMLNDKGEIFGVGTNRYGVLVGSKVESFGTPHRMMTPNNEKVLKVAVARNNTHILTDKGHIYSLGANKWGQLGVKAASERVKWTAPDVPEGTKFTDMIVPDYAADYAECTIYAKTNKGELVVWGSSSPPTLFSEATARKTYRGPDTEEISLHDVIPFPDKGNDFFARGNTLYVGTVYNYQTLRTVEMIPQVTVPGGIATVSNNMIGTKDNQILSIERRKSGDGGGFETEPIILHPPDSFTNEKVFVSTCELANNSPKILMGVNGSTRKRLTFKMNDNVYSCISTQTGFPPGMNYTFDVEATRAIAAVSGSFLNYDSEFISDSIHFGCM